MLSSLHKYPSYYGIDMVWHLHNPGTVCSGLKCYNLIVYDVNVVEYTVVLFSLCLISGCWQQEYRGTHCYGNNLYACLFSMLQARDYSLNVADASRFMLRVAVHTFFALRKVMIHSTLSSKADSLVSVPSYVCSNASEWLRRIGQYFFPTARKCGSSCPLFVI